MESPKKVLISGINNRYQIKKHIHKDTEKKDKKHIYESDGIYIHDNQISLVNELNSNLIENPSIKCSSLINPDAKQLYKEISKKVSSYKQQDISKNRLDTLNFTSISNILSLLHSSTLKCEYCKQNVFVFYQKVMENHQWTLDRIDNDLGHNLGNIVISCLLCNVKRKKIAKDKYDFTRNLNIVKKTEE